MKKIILSLMIVLGTTLGVQAQTFDFSCATTEEEREIYDAEFLPISDGFSTTDIGSLQTDGFEIIINDNGDEVLNIELTNPLVTLQGGEIVTFNGDFDRWVQVGVFYDERGSQVQGPFAYRVGNARGFGSIDFSNGLEEVLYLLLPNRFTVAQRAILDTNEFTFDNNNVASDGGVYNLEQDLSNDLPILLYDDDGEYYMWFSTLQAAITAYADLNP